MELGRHLKHEWEHPFEESSHSPLVYSEEFSLVPDYGYYNWLFHPVSPTIYHGLELSCNACYNFTFQPFVRRFRRIAFPNEVPSKSLFQPFVFENFGLSEKLLWSEDLSFSVRQSVTEVTLCLLLFRINILVNVLPIIRLDDEPNMNALVRTSAFPECGFENPVDLVSGSIKYHFPSPFFQSSFLSLVW